MKQGVVSQRSRRSDRSKGDWLDYLLWFLITKVLPGIAFGVLFFIIFLLLSVRIECNCNHGDSFDEFVRTIQALDYEVHGDFTVSGWKICEVTQYNQDTVTYTTAGPTLAKIAGLGQSVSVHNHPDNSPFSNVDLLDIAQQQPTLEIVVTDEMVYTLEARNGWPSQSEVEAFISGLGDYFSSGRLPEEEAAEAVYNSEKRWFEIFYTETFIEDFVAEFDLAYMVVPADDWLAS